MKKPARIFRDGAHNVLSSLEILFGLDIVAERNVAVGVRITS
jgi:hypothetical protein